MTFLALLFFVKFPVKPSERIISSMGRQGIYRQNISYSETTTTTTQTTTETTTLQTTTKKTTHKEFVITITTGKGFKTEAKGHDVPVMDYDYEQETTETTTASEYYTNEYDYDEYNYEDYNSEWYY